MPSSRNILGQLIYFIKALSHLLYPDLCLHCKRSIQQKPPFLCYACLSAIELVKWREKEAHHLLEQSVNKPGLLFSSVLYRFEEGNPVQTILHELKYKNNRSIGLYFGSLLGQEIERKQISSSIDALIPVPIHHRKRFDRGYNQSELLARGISLITHLPVKTGLLSKTRNSKSQTKLSKEERRENTIDTFSVSDEVKKYTSIALVDDVVTTGATISTICDVLRKKNKDLQITIFSLSIANNNS
mgnify:FL=1